MSSIRLTWTDYDDDKKDFAIGFLVCIAVLYPTPYERPTGFLKMHHNNVVSPQAILILDNVLHDIK